jgi:hypothetical protein
LLPPGEGEADPNNSHIRTKSFWSSRLLTSTSDTHITG